ncbi:NAD(P)H-hydrate epimerase, partial [bacterium]|nr:NAD(P)H-hydrate epimerase [bacterium]
PLMRWITCQQMRDIDRRAIEELGIPAVVLMENAGRGVADEVRSLYAERDLDGPIPIFCGAGNNGGDGFVIARHLANAGLAPRVICCAPREKIDRSREAGINLTICERMGLPMVDAADPRVVEDELSRGALAVDAIFGIGLSKPPREPQASMLRLIDAAGIPVVAVDVPSGLDGDTGIPPGACLHADVTATMAFPKVGMRGAGEEWVGRLVVVDIGLPAWLADSVAGL